jgi:hypothetical protein
MRAHSGTRPRRRRHRGRIRRWRAGSSRTGLRYGLGQSSANVVTVDSGARVVALPVAVRWGRVRALPDESSAAAYDPRLHDASFLVERLPPGWSRGSAWTLPDPVVRATFGRPARSYRFDGYEVLVWNVNLLTRMGE